MNHLRQIAKAHCQNGSEETKALAHKFFNAMDTDGDGKITLSEFMEFVKEEGHEGMDKPLFFQLLDTDENGLLDFDEVMTLYYIVRSKRPFCNRCHMFVTGTYYTCAQCFGSPHLDDFFLCHNCYLSRDWDHDIKGRRCQLLDNYTLLQLNRFAHLDQQTSSPASSGYERIESGGSSSSTAIVLASQVSALTIGRTKWKAALRTFEAALTVASIGTGAAGLCTIL